MFNFGFKYPIRRGGGGGVAPFSPLDYSPAFWFDYNDYPLGTMSGLLDKTGDYTATSVNTSEVVVRSGINVYENVKASLQAVQYNSDFLSIIQNPHTHIITYEPKEISTPLNAFFASSNASGTYHYGLYQSLQKIRIYMKINNVLTQIDTVLDVFTNLDMKYIEVYIAQTGIKVYVNGVSLALTDTIITSPSLLSTMSNLPNLTMAARSLTGSSAGLNANAYFGDHLLYPNELTLAQRTELINYFI